jgi:hypothetical protein
LFFSITKGKKQANEQTSKNKNKKQKIKPGGQERPVEGLKTRKGSQKEKQLDAFDEHILAANIIYKYKFIRKIRSKKETQISTTFYVCTHAQLHFQHNNTILSFLKTKKYIGKKRGNLFFCARNNWMAINISRLALLGSLLLPY